MQLPRCFFVASCLVLAGCWSEGDDQTAEEVQASFDNTAEEYDQAAKNASGREEERLEDTAEVYRETGEAAADAVDRTDMQANAQ